MQTAKEISVENTQAELRREKKLEDIEKLLRKHVTQLK